MMKAFFDHIATTPVDPRVEEGMRPYFREVFGNPSSLFYEAGQMAHRAVEEARKKVADLIGARSEEIIFTSGATESNNLALQGIALAHQEKGRHLILSEIEHFSVLNVARALERLGFEVTLLPVDSEGLVDPRDVERAIRKETILISVMHANNEIGSIEPIEEIGRIAQERGIAFHSDAMGTAGTIPLDVGRLGVTALTFAAHAFYGPKGVGALYLKKGIRLQPLFYGGYQEVGYRSGTENVPGIVGMGIAADLARQEITSRNEHLLFLRQKLWQGLEERVEYLHFTGHPVRRLPGHVSFWVEYAEGESLLLMLSLKEIATASGSACSSNIRGEDEKDLAASRVLNAIGVPSDICTGSLTLSLGKENTLEEVEYFLEVFPGIVKKLWEMSPFYSDAMKKKSAI